MKLSELKQIIRECIEEVGPARQNRRNSKYKIKDVGNTDPTTIKRPLNGNRGSMKRRDTTHSVGIDSFGHMDRVKPDWQKGNDHWDRRFRGSYKKMDDKAKKLREAGPARKHRKAKGYQYKDGLNDPLLYSIKDRKDWASTGRGVPNERYARNVVRVQGTQYAAKRPAGDNRYRGSFDRDDHEPRKIGSFKKIGKLGEGVRRNRRLATSKDPNSEKNFYIGIRKTQRRNEKGIKKYGQVNLANARLNSRKPIGEEKKYHTSPPKTGFDRTEPMAYKKNSLSGKIANGLRRVERKAGKHGIKPYSALSKKEKSIEDKRISDSRSVKNEASSKLRVNLKPHEQNNREKYVQSILRTKRMRDQAQSQKPNEKGNK